MIYRFKTIPIKISATALDSVAQLVGVSSHNRNFVGSIPSQSTYSVVSLISGPGIYGPWFWCIQEATNPCFYLALIFLSLPTSLPSCSKSNEIMSSDEDKTISSSFSVEIDKFTLKLTRKFKGIKTAKNLEEEQSWRTHIFQLQNLLQSYSNQDCGTGTKIDI